VVLGAREALKAGGQREFVGVSVVIAGAPGRSCGSRRTKGSTFAAVGAGDALASLDFPLRDLTGAPVFLRSARLIASLSRLSIVDVHGLQMVKRGVRFVDELRRAVGTPSRADQRQGLAGEAGHFVGLVAAMR